VSTISSAAMPASNAMVSKLYGNNRGISAGLNQDALCRDCSMLIDIHSCGKLVCLVYLVHLVDLVHLVFLFIWLVWFNQINKTNQINEIDQTDQTNQINKTDSLAPYDHGDYLPPGSASNPHKLGIPSSEGIGIYLYPVIPDSLTTRRGCGRARLSEDLTFSSEP